MQWACKSMIPKLAFLRVPRWQVRRPPCSAPCLARPGCIGLVVDSSPRQPDGAEVLVRPWLARGRRPTMYLSCMPKEIFIAPKSRSGLGGRKISQGDR